MSENTSGKHHEVSGEDARAWVATRWARDAQGLEKHLGHVERRIRATTPEQRRRLQAALDAVSEAS